MPPSGNSSTPFSARCMMRASARGNASHGSAGSGPGPRNNLTTRDGRRSASGSTNPFKEVKKSTNNIFRGNEEISFSPRALAFMVSELSKYEFTRIDVDAKGAAYQELVGTNLRGDRGQYFTPRGAVRLVVEILDPKENEKSWTQPAARAASSSQRLAT